MILNKDYKDRDYIIFGASIGTDYDIMSFSQLTGEKCKELMDENFADPEDRQNEAPSFKEFTEFCLKYPKVTAYGYVVNPNREDYRVTIEGLDYKGKTSKQMIIDFTSLCEDADDFVANNDELFCWYD